MAARHEGGQAGIEQQIDKLLGYARTAESIGDFALAATYYRHALALIDESGAGTGLRPVVESGLRSAEAALGSRPSG